MVYGAYKRILRSISVVVLVRCSYKCRENTVQLLKFHCLVMSPLKLKLYSFTARSMASKTFLFIWAIPIAFMALIYSSNEFAWVVVQFMHTSDLSTYFPEQVGALERSVWSSWESEALRKTYDHETMLLQIPIITSPDQFKDIDFTRPFLVRNLSKGVVLQEKDFLSPPISNITIEYYSDARKVGAWSPDAVGQVGDVARAILAGGNMKFLTQKIAQGHPQLIADFIDLNPWVDSVFGKERVDGWKSLAKFVRVPMFMAKGKDLDTLEGNVRTDCHAEPASNLALQTLGRKRWTLVEPRYSHLLRPRISISNTPYCIAQIDMLDKKSFWHVPRYEIETVEGDALYLPAWTWHRVEYLPKIVSSHLSFFEMIRNEFLFNKPILTISAVPLLVKRAFRILIGMKLDL
jgi:hypothetical protein